jgi:hypothetical protein
MSHLWDYGVMAHYFSQPNVDELLVGKKGMVGIEYRRSGPQVGVNSGK